MSAVVESRYQATGSGDRNRLRRPSVIVNCSHELFKSSINPITNPSPVYSDSIFCIGLSFLVYAQKLNA
jgi:hypothetical protein